MSRSAEHLLWHEYLAARRQAADDWHRVARLAELLVTQFDTEAPHGGDLDALTVAFTSATAKTRQAVAKYREYCTRQP